MLNARSKHLVILLATFNRLHLLKRALESISSGTTCSHEVIVIDGGSTDGTIEYLKSLPNITPVFQGKLLGSSRAYNEVWRQIECKYTCWLSDDTEIVDGSLDMAIKILEARPEIGMVGLKMKDTMGPKQWKPYAGGICIYGMLNCNHGVLSMDLLRAVGFFNESYRAYTIDKDLTASVLCAGKSVVMTKRVSVLHHREWAEQVGGEFWLSGKVQGEMRGIDNEAIYREKFRFLERSRTLLVSIRFRLGRQLGRILFSRANPGALRWGLSHRDWQVLTEARFIRITDPIDNRRRPYHLVQRVPERFLASEANPHGHLLNANRRGSVEPGV